jgi:integrase
MTESKPSRKKGRSGEGTIYWSEAERCFIGEISLGFNPDGSRNRPKARGASKAAVKEKLKELKDDYEDGIETSSKYTVEQAARDWLKRGLPNREKATVGKLTSLTEKHIIPNLGQAKLKKLTADHVDDFLASLTEDYASSTIARILNTLARIIRFAQARNKVRRNVAELVEAPKGTEGRPSKAMTLDQAKAILAASRGSWIHPYIAVSVFTGVRTEEARPLRWEHTHLNPVNGQTCTCGKQHTETLAPHVEVWRSVRFGGDTKTPKSRRTIALPEYVVTILTAYRVKIQLDIEDAGGDPGAVKYVFATSVNTVHDSANVRRDVRRVVKAAGVEGTWTPREFRHTFVSLMSDNGATDELIADLVGHKRTSTTREVYRRQLRPVITKGAELLDTAFGEGRIQVH